MNTLIKICGIRSLEDLKDVKENKAFWYGLIFFKKSPRNVSVDEAELLVKNTPKFINPVAVTVNPEESFIKKLISKGIVNIQLHGNESPDFCQYLKNKYNIKIFKAIGVEDYKDIKLADLYTNIADWIIFDKKDDKLYGGTGKNFDWNILSKIDINIKYIISGGLNHKNVKDALEKTNASGVDVSSGVESELGVKSKELIKKFCEAAKMSKR